MVERYAAAMTSRYARHRLIDARGSPNARFVQCHVIITSRCCDEAVPHQGGCSGLEGESLRRLRRKAPGTRIGLRPRWRPPHRHTPGARRKRHLTRHECGPGHRPHRTVRHRIRAAAAVRHPRRRHARIRALHSRWRQHLPQLLPRLLLPLLLRAPTTCASRPWRVRENSPIRRRRHSAFGAELTLLLPLQSSLGLLFTRVSITCQCGATPHAREFRAPFRRRRSPRPLQPPRRPSLKRRTPSHAASPRR